MTKGKCRHRVEAHQNIVESVSISADGNTALSCSRDGFLKLWDVASGECIHNVDQSKYCIFSTVLSKDGRYALSGDGLGRVKLWDVRAAKCLHTFEGHKEAVFSVAFSADGRYAVSGSRDSTARWMQIGLSNRTAPWYLDKPESSTEAIERAGQFKKLIQEAADLREHGDYIGQAARLRQAGKIPGYNRKDEFVAAWASIYSYLPKCCITDGWEKMRLEGHENEITSVAISDDGKLCRIREPGDETVRVWDLSTGQCIRVLRGHKSYVKSVVFVKKGQQVISGGIHVKRIWDISTGTYKEYNGGAEFIDTLDDGRHVMFAGSSQIEFWDLAANKCLREIKIKPYEYVLSAALAKDGVTINAMVTNDKKSNYCVWNIETGQRELLIEIPTKIFIMGKSGQFIYSDVKEKWFYDISDELEKINPATGERIKDYPAKNMISFLISPDEKYLCYTHLSKYEAGTRKRSTCLISMHRPENCYIPYPGRQVNPRLWR